jgi:hypothetical protein
MSDEAIIELPRDRETGLRVGRIVLYGPVGSGKTLSGTALAKMMAPPGFEEIFILSPVPTAANLLPQANWYKISPQDKKKVEAFMAKMKEKRALLIVDEADAYFGGSARTFGTPSMADAVLIGRNACLSMIVIAHGTSLAPKSLLGNSAAVFFYRTTEVNLLNYAEEYMAADIPDVVHILRNLPDYVALVYAPMSREKFVGFAKLDIQTQEFKIWKPDNDQTGPDTQDQLQTSTSEEAPSSPDESAPSVVAP